MEDNSSRSQSFKMQYWGQLASAFNKAKAALRKKVKPSLPRSWGGGSAAGVMRGVSDHSPMAILPRQHKAPNSGEVSQSEAAIAERSRCKKIMMEGIECGKAGLAYALAFRTEESLESAVAILRGNTGFYDLLQSTMEGV